MVWAFGCSANIHSFWDAKSFIKAIVHRKKFTKATFSWLTNNVAEVAVSIDGEDKKIRGRRLGLLLCGCFLFHDSQIQS